MSLSSGIDQNNPDPDYRGKFYPDLIPFNHPLGQQNLGEVLATGNQALSPTTGLPQDATDFATLGCVKIETGTVGMGNQPALVIGEPGDILQIKGATLLGSLLVGNGLDTEGLPVGANGLVLKANSGAPLGVEWGTDASGGTVMAVNAGTNISVSGTIAQPIVNVSNPLTSVLNLGTQNITGTTSSITLTNNAGPINSKSTTTAGAYKIEDINNANTYSTMVNNFVRVQDSQDQMVYNSSTIAKTGLYSLNMTSQTGFNLVGTNAPFTINAGTSTIQITQPAGQATKLSTDLTSNAVFYPDIVVESLTTFPSTISVPLPAVIHQRLTITNIGLTSNTIWNDYGNAVFTGYSAFAYDTNGNVWLADQSGTGSIKVWDNTITTLLHSITTATGAGFVNINALKQVGNYMFIAGNFQSINGNATAQYGITRVDTTTYIEDPMYDGASGIYGVQVGAEVFCIEEANGEVLIGGTFTTLSTGGACNHIARIGNPLGASGSQTYSEYNGGVDARVFTIYHDSNTNYTWLGGDFINVNITLGILNYSYCAYYDNGTASWGMVAGNGFNSRVAIIKPTSYGHLWVGGSFGPIAFSGQSYNTYIENTNPATYNDTTLVMGTPPNYKQAFYNGSIYVDNVPDLYYSNAYQTWTSLGAYGGAGIVSGINLWNGESKVISESYTHIRSTQAVGDDSIFIGNFKYNGITYANYTITPTNWSQQFIADTTCNFWSPIGSLIGTFS